MRRKIIGLVGLLACSAVYAYPVQPSTADSIYQVPDRSITGANPTASTRTEVLDRSVTGSAPVTGTTVPSNPSVPGGANRNSTMVNPNTLPPGTVMVPNQSAGVGR